jgi:hypothetical protein
MPIIKTNISTYQLTNLGPYALNGFPYTKETRGSVFKRVRRLQRQSQTVEVRPSTIPGAGLGLFAKKNFAGRKETKLGKKPGEKIVPYSGRLIDTETEALPSDKTYVLQLDARYFVDAQDYRLSSLGRYANCSAQIDQRNKLTKGNNAEFAIDVAKQTAWIRAKKPIKAGEEIFVSYRRPCKK